ncbi:Autophagy-related protein 27 [Lasallia pustulata]|uniref:Autophagy-related protein 27 n=1 Tax=Lasallia pustulata TaxID=136370 RepID=A0A1W5D3V6_9LECA|nr:Autophagy-related protein 27 [Lasallia pustulata]
MQIAGDYPHTSGRSLDPKWQRLKPASSGIRLEMHGGKLPPPHGRKQMAVIDFLCPAAAAETAAATDGEEGEGDGEEGAGLRFVGYGPAEEEEGKETDVLRLEWRTRYACEGSIGKGGEGKGGHWGFFTWFILM